MWEKEVRPNERNVRSEENFSHTHERRRRRAPLSPTTTVATLVYTCKRDTSWQWSDCSPRTRGRVEVEEDSSRSELFIERDARCAWSCLATHIYTLEKIAADWGPLMTAAHTQPFTVTLIVYAATLSVLSRVQSATRWEKDRKLQSYFELHPCERRWALAAWEKYYVTEKHLLSDPSCFPGVDLPWRNGRKTSGERKTVFDW